MFEEEKESFWKKKGFYVSVCAALLCVLAIGTLYYKMNYQNNNGKNLFADSATSVPDTTNGIAGGSAIGSGNDITAGNNNSGTAGTGTDVAQNGMDNNESVQAGSITGNNTDNLSNDTGSTGNTDNGTDSTKTADNTNGTDSTDNKSNAGNTDSKDSADGTNNTDTSKNNKTDSTAEKAVADAGIKNKVKKAASTKKVKQEESAGNKQADDGKDSTDNALAAMSDAGSNKFDMEKGLLWPVDGEVVLKYSMNNTVYFKTLAQYKCNPAIVISSGEGTAVKAAAGGTVTKVSKSDETGNTVTMDIGSGYTVTYGQLEDISVKEGQTVGEGTKIGKVAKPTKYYSEEGSNLYFQVMEKGKPVDPMLLLR